MEKMDVDLDTSDDKLVIDLNETPTSYNNQLEPGEIDDNVEGVSNNIGYPSTSSTTTNGGTPGKRVKSEPPGHNSVKQQPEQANGELKMTIKRRKSNSQSEDDQGTASMSSTLGHNSISSGHPHTASADVHGQSEGQFCIPLAKCDQQNGSVTPQQNSTTTTKQSSTSSKKKKQSSGNAASSAAAAKTPKAPVTDSNKKKATCITQAKVEKRDTGTWVRTVASETDPEALGPCEPGTQITLEGVVWNEISNGVLVVNVTWRGRSYVGSLLDCTKHDWAPPRVCESPLLDLDKTPAKGRNGKRNRSSMSHSASTSDITQLNKSKAKKSKLTVSVQPLSVVIQGGSTSDEDSQSGLTTQPPLPETILEPLSPVLNTCPCKTCDKRFSEHIGLKFHQTAAHPKCSTPDLTESNNIITTITANNNNNIIINNNNNNNISTAAAAATAEGITAEQSESLARLFQVVGERGSTTPQAGSVDLPKLEPPVGSEPVLADQQERSDTRSPGAYSDISDDGGPAPVLEKEVTSRSPKKGVPVVGQASKLNRSPRAEVVVVRNEQQKIENPRAPVGQQELRRISDIKPAHVATIGLNAVKPSALPPSTSIVSPIIQQHNSAKPVATVAGSPNFIQSIGGSTVPSPMMLPFSGPPGAPFSGPPGTPFNGPPGAPFTGPPGAPFLRPPLGLAHHHPAFHAHGHGHHGLFIPPVTSSPSPSSLGKHKIHELAAKGVPSPGPPTAGGSLTTGKSSSSTGISPADLTPGSVSSPPVQRHVHMHQHTHTFPPFMDNPYVSQAAPFSLFGGPSPVVTTPTMSVGYGGGALGPPSTTS